MTCECQEIEHTNTKTKTNETCVESLDGECDASPHADAARTAAPRASSSACLCICVPLCNSNVSSFALCVCLKCCRVAWRVANAGRARAGADRRRGQCVVGTRRSKSAFAISGNACHGPVSCGVCLLCIDFCCCLLTVVMMRRNWFVCCLGCGNVCVHVHVVKFVWANVTQANEYLGFLKLCLPVSSLFFFFFFFFFFFSKTWHMAIYLCIPQTNRLLFRIIKKKLTWINLKISILQFGNTSPPVSPTPHQQFAISLLLGASHTKITAGGRIFSFSALVVVGDGRGTAGFGYGKALTGGGAVLKATRDAEKRKCCLLVQYAICNIRNFYVKKINLTVSFSKFVGYILIHCRVDV